MKMSAERHPIGPADSITAEWKAEVDRLLREKGISRQDLATHCGVKPSAITMMLGAKSKSTRIKAKVHEKLGLVAHESTPAVQNEEKIRLFLRRWRDLSEKQRDLILNTMDELLAKH